MRRRSAARAFCVALLAISVAGCSFPSDYFGTRAIEYNREAEDATLSTMLLNIVRASQRRPMQFTGLQSVTGTSTTSGTVGGSNQKVHNIPTVPIQPATSSVLSHVLTSAGNISGSISGGPTFTVPVLDTQEFYQGILTPIPLSVIDFYLQEGFPPALLADLFILDIVVTRIDDGGSCQQFTFSNSVSDDLQFGQFQAMVDYLVVSGFIAERVSRTTAYGPELPQPRAADAARAVDAYAHAAQAGLDLKKGKGGRFSLQKKSNELRTCFIYKGGDYPSWLAAKDKSIFCGNFGKQQPGAKAGGEEKAGGQCTPKKSLVRRDSAGDTNAKYDTNEQGVTANGQSEFKGIALAPAVLDRIEELQREQIALSGNQIPYDQLFPVREFRGAHISMKFHTRSTEGILYYLGEIVRRSLAPERAAPRVMQAKTSLNYGAYPLRECSGPEPVAEVVPLSNQPRYRFDAGIPVRCEPIFVVNEGPSVGNNVVSVIYNGMMYSVPHSREAGGRSSQVVELVKQILNLNTSAKSLPTTTVISVVGAQ